MHKPQLHFELPQVSFKSLRVDQIVPHSDVMNYMTGEMRTKLKVSLETYRFYIPLIVRMLSEDEGRYQIVDGHFRWRILKELGYREIDCVVWNVDDHQARELLVILNNLRGQDIPERRMILLEDMLKEYGLDELIQRLPYSRKVFEGVYPQDTEKLSDPSIDSHRLSGESKRCVQLLLNFSEEDAAFVSACFQAVQKSLSLPSPSLALVALAKGFLNGCRSLVLNS